MIDEDQKKYLQMIRRFPLRPIRTEQELDCALQVIDSLLDRFPLCAGEQDYLQVLGDLVRAYEDEHYPMPVVSDDRLLRHLIEAQGITQTELADATGIVNSTISAVLKGTRRLSRKQIGVLAAYFQVEPGAFAFGEGKRGQAKPRLAGSKRKT